MSTSSFKQPLQQSLQRGAIWFVLLAVVTTLFVPTNQPAQANGGIPLSIFDPASTGWASVRNMGSAAFHQNFLEKIW